MYKIFQENKALIFPKIDGNALKFDAMLPESDRYEIDILCDFLLEWLADKEQTDTFVHEVGENAVVEALKTTFRMAPAAGGIVVKDGKIVSIVRNGIPDEVTEETGIGNLQIVKALPSSWHCYQVGEEWRLKRTYWYLMESGEAIQPKPQTEEGITEIKLIGNEDIEAFLKGTFRSISEILGKDLHKVVTK